jgi:hypothetical protein
MTMFACPLAFVAASNFRCKSGSSFRNVRVLLEKDKAGDNFVDVMKNILENGLELYDEAEALYKK